MTLPSHASLFSGLYPRWHGAYCSKSAPRGRPIADAPRLLAERLGERGYLTMGLAANHYVSPEFGLAKGFVAFRNTVRIDLTSAATAYTLRPLLRQIVEFFCPLPEFDRTPYSAQELTDLALDLVEDAADCAAPSMLFLNYMDAHIPYVPPPPYDTKFPGLKTDLLSLESFTEIREGFLGGEDELREDQRLHFISQYDGALAYLDANITRLVERLKELDQYHDTLLIVMADHGEAFGEKGLLEHQVGTYESTIGVPLIIKYPSQVEPRVVEAPISIVDVPATIVDAAGVDGGQIHGRSLLAAREGHGQPVFAELLACATTREINPIFERKEQAAVSGDWKLIRSDRSPHQLYHLAEDPTEKTNLQTQRRDKERRLERILKNWAAGFPAPDSESLEIDPELLERLRSLGYL